MLHFFTFPTLYMEAAKKQQPFDYLQEVALEEKRSIEKTVLEAYSSGDDKTRKEIEAALTNVSDDFTSVLSDPDLSDLDISSSGVSYEPAKLNARHREIIRLAALGYKHVQIASILGISPVTVGYIIRSPLGQQFLREIGEARTDSVKDVQNRLNELSPLAVETVLDVMTTAKDNVRGNMAIKVLEMTGHKATEKHDHNHLHLTKEDILEIKREYKGGPKIVEEASYEEVSDNKEILDNEKES